MAIDVPAPKQVKAGEPVTAEGWNAIVNAINATIQYLNTSEASSVRVVIKNTGVTSARVTASRDDGVTFEAVAPVPPGTQYIVAGLRAGGYKIRVDAPGFNRGLVDITAPVANPVEVTLAASGALMPALFGLELRAALLELKNRNIAVDRVLDVVGRDVAPANPDPAYVNQPVLMQLPEAGAAVPPEGRVQLVVSAALQAEAAVEVPSLAGLTLAEAQKALENVGLKLGKSTTTQTKS
jgi:hypothetical protein